MGRLMKKVCLLSIKYGECALNWFPEQSQSTLSKCIEGWTSRIFLITQTSGILAVVLHQLNWGFEGSQIISIVVWLFTIVIYLLFLPIYVVKVFMFTRKVHQQLDQDIVELCCLASISITLGVISDMVTIVCAEAWGPSWGMGAYVLTWINVVLATLAIIGIPYKQFASNPPGIDKTPPNIQLPSIATVTAAAQCGVTAFAGMLDPRLQVPLIIVGYVLLGLGLPFSFIITAVYIARLLDQGLPPRFLNAANWILVGPLAQAAYAFQILGSATESPGKEPFARYSKGYFITASAGQIISTASTLAGLMLWGYATFWILFCLTATIHLEFFTQGGLRNSKYSLSVWSPGYPIGVYTLASMHFGKIMDAPAWNAISSVYENSSGRNIIL